MKRLSGNILPLYTSTDIKKRVKELGEEISKKYKNRNPVIIGVLNGSFIFLADLVRQIKLDCRIDFIQVSSYSGEKSLGKVKFLKDISINIKNKDIIIIEDIIDTGKTLKFIFEHIKTKSPKSLSIATLLYKPKIKKNIYPIDFIGFEIPNKFVVGYGLDYNQKMRHLDGIYYLKNSYLTKGENGKQQ